MLFKRIALFSLIAFLPFNMFGQESENKTQKHKIKESVGYAGLGITPLYGNLTINYELIRIERPNKVFKKRGIRLGTGIYQYYSDGSLNLIVSYTSLTGTENNHLEVGLGIAYMHFLTNPGRYLAPAPNIGYRFHKPNGKFIFRTGIGFPELLYTGFGYVFN